MLILAEGNGQLLVTYSRKGAWVAGKNKTENKAQNVCWLPSIGLKGALGELGVPSSPSNVLPLQKPENISGQLVAYRPEGKLFGLRKLLPLPNLWLHGARSKGGGHGLCLGGQLFVGGPARKSGPFTPRQFGGFLQAPHPFFQPSATEGPGAGGPPQRGSGLRAPGGRKVWGSFVFFLSADGHGPSPKSQSPRKYKDTRKEVFKRGPWPLRRDGVSRMAFGWFWMAPCSFAEWCCALSLV